MSGGWRLFVAAPIPQALREAALEWAAAHLRRGWRYLRAEQLHVTLRFLGATPPERVAPLVRALEGRVAAFAPFEVAVRGWGVFPSAARPRVAWAGIHEGAERLASLAAAVEQSVRAAGFAPETRPFRAHLTLARARRDERPGLPGRPAAATPDLGRFVLGEVALMRSHLEPAGARYEAVARFRLGGKAAAR